jgi:hypothetical protein
MTHIKKCHKKKKNKRKKRKRMTKLTLEDVFAYNIGEISTFFAKDELREEDTLLDIRYFLIRDAYDNKEFPAYQMDILSQLPLSMFRKEEDLYTILYKEHIKFKFLSLFLFSFEFLRELTHNFEEEDIHLLRSILGKMLYEDDMLQYEDLKYVISPCYKVNMLNADNEREAKYMFFSYDYYKDKENKGFMEKVIKRLSYNKYKEEEKDLNVYLFEKYEDEFTESMNDKKDKKIHSLITSIIISITEIKVDARKNMLHFLFEESKNTFNLALIAILHNFRDIMSDYPFNMPFFHRLESYVPYKISNNVKYLYQLYNIYKDLNIDIYIQSKDGVNEIVLDKTVALILEDARKDIRDTGRKLHNLSSYTKILDKSSVTLENVFADSLTPFIYKYLAPISNLEDFLIQFVLTIDFPTAHERYMYNRDLLIYTLFASYLLSEDEWIKLQTSYPFETNEELLHTTVIALLRLRGSLSQTPFTLKFAKISLMAQHFDLINNNYGATFGFMLSVFIRPLNAVVFPRYLEETEDVTRLSEEQVKEMYKRGINVHADNRDIKTIEGLKLLIEQQGPLTKKEVERYFSDFISYALEVLNENDVDILNHILGMNIVTGEIMERRQASDFEGFLEDKMLMIGNYTIEPKELIARFFHFSQTYEDIRDRENLKYGTLRGLMTSLQDDTTEEQRMNAEAYGIKMTKNHIVCNPGKVQRLVASTLSGRLRDKDEKVFDIDERVQREEVKKEVANLDEIHQYLTPFINMYMYEEETRVNDAASFFTKLYEYVYHLRNGDVAKFGKVVLNMSYVVYYSCMMAMKGNVLYIDPEFALTSEFSDMFDLKYYIDKFGEEEQRAWRETHPEEVRRLEQGRENRVDARRVEEVRRRQENRRRYKEMHGRSPDV